MSTIDDQAAGEHAAGFWRGPWGQMVLYLVLFIIAGAILVGLHSTMKGRDKPDYVPFHSEERMGR